MEAFFAALAAFGAVSIGITKIVDLFRNWFDKDDKVPKAVWNGAALALGLGYALGWQVDLSATVFELVPASADKSDRLAGITGQVLTGLVAGAFAGFWHELLDALNGIAKDRHARAEAIDAAG